MMRSALRFGSGKGVTQMTNPTAYRAALLAAATLHLTASSAASADWPQWLGPGRNGITNETVEHWPPKVLWRASVGVGYTSPVVARGRAYFVGHESRPDEKKGTDVVSCLDAASGAILWRHSYDCLTEKRDRTAGYPGPRATPAVDGDAVYTLSLEGHLFCLDSTTGDVVWSRNLPKDMGAKVPFYGYCGSPLVHGDRVVVEANVPDGGSYVAFDRKTGEVVWKNGSESASTASPALMQVDGRAVVLFISDQVLAAHDLETGSQLWRVELGWTTWMGPVPADDLVFASSASLSRGCAVFRFGSDGPLWKARRTYQALHCNTVIWDGHVYGSDNTRTDYQYQDGNRSRLKCIELTTGEVKWTLKGMGWANVLVARDKLLVLRESGELVLMEASPSGHAEVGRAQELEGPCWTVPALARGRIYCRSNKGEVVCLDVGGNGQGISPPRRQGAKDDNGIQPPMDADSRR